MTVLLHSTAEAYARIVVEWTKEFRELAKLDISTMTVEQSTKLNALMIEANSFGQELKVWDLGCIPIDFQCDHIRALLCFWSIMQDIETYNAMMNDPELTDYQKLFQSGILNHEVNLFVDSILRWGNSFDKVTVRNEALVSELEKLENDEV